MGKAKRKEAFAYLRVSSRGQRDGHGFERQRQEIERYCRRAGYRIAGIYQDAHTGTASVFKRPGFSDLLAAMGAEGGVIVVERFDRLARSVVEGEQAVIALANYQISIICVDTGENITEAYEADPMRKAMMQMKAVFSELEKSTIVKKLRVAREAKRQQVGRCEGALPFGAYKDEVPTLRYIRKLRRRRKGLPRWGARRIAAALNDEGYPTRSGRPWCVSTVANILERLSA